MDQPRSQGSLLPAAWRGVPVGRVGENPGNEVGNGHNNNNNGNFICVFGCTIVNLASYRQFTNAA